MNYPKELAKDRSVAFGKVVAQRFHNPFCSMTIAVG